MAFETKVCSRCGREWHASMVRSCPHPKVNEVYGEHICIYCCKRCKLRIPVQFIDGLKCGYTKGR